ncbi:MAG: ABC transporter ATP-binding protein [Clostridiaceae bacterium]|nr:ABC transporter ATP-binding protein [Clostridiaceae bacterium]
MKQYRTILPFIKQHKSRYFLGILALIFVDITHLLVPQVLRAFADWMQKGELNVERITFSALAVIILGLCVAIGRYGWRMNLFGTARKLEYWLRAKLFNKYLSLDDSFYNYHRTGDLMAHVTNDVLMVRNSMGGGIIMIIDSIFMTIFTVIMMIYTVGFKTALIALTALPFLTIFVFFVLKPMQLRSRRVQDSFSEMTNEVQENISGIHNIKAFGIEDNRSRSFSRVNQDYQRKNIDMMRLNVLFDPIVSLISGIALVVFIVYGVYRLLDGSMTLGDFVAIIDYLRLMVWPLIAIALVVNSFQRGIASMTRINEILAVKSRIVESTAPAEVDLSSVKIEFRDVSFRYNNKSPWVLKNISFVLENQKSIAILGRTGSGKSTVLQLLLRRYDVNSGQILLNDIDIRDLALTDLYRAIALVEQESFLFSRSIARNIAFSSSDDYDSVKVRRSAEFSQISQDIAAMPDGYDTWVGERGVTLSGGQKQRISLARAHYKDTKVLVMDDSLSAVDTNTEKSILKQLKKYQQSLILVSQRVSTVQAADQILVIEDGEITQRGDHVTLLQDTEGFYARLYQRQLLESELTKEINSIKQDNYLKEDNSSVY